MTARTRRRPHQLVIDRDVPADQQGQVCCATCHAMGRPGVGVHALPDVPEQAEHRRRAGDGGEG